MTVRAAGVVLAVVLLAGCALKMAPTPTTATDEQRRQAEACHVAALKAVDERPGPLASWRPTGISELGLAVLGLAVVSAPVWYPIVKTRHDQRNYDAAFDRCMIHGPTAVLLMGASVCYQDLVREGSAFCTGDITGFTLPEPDSHWMVRP